mgnify:CR=1 FL=1
MMRKILLVAFVLVGLGVGLLAQGLTADEILARVEEKGFMGGETGKVISVVRFTITEGDVTNVYSFRVYSSRGIEGQPDKSLIVYLEPELVAGTMFLTWTPEEGKARMWLYLPALGLVKELISEEARKQEFISGSGITREDIAEGFKYRDDYNAKLSGEEEVEGTLAYVITLTPKQGHEVEWPKVMLWVDKENFVVVRTEFYDAEGNLGKVIEATDFSSDELGYIPHKLTIKDLKTGNVAVLEILERKKADIPDDYFDPEKLPLLQIPLE